MGVAAILTWNQVRANWPYHIFYGQLVPSGALWPLGHILPSLSSLANFHLTNPQAFIFDFGPGGSFCLLGASRPPSHHLWFWATPFHYRGLGLDGLFGPFRPPMASTVRGPRSIGQLGPFWPNPMRPKGEARWVPNHNWTHLSQFWPPIPWTQFWPKTFWTPNWPPNP
ncbi:hypothetical protein O181_115080 [Austropuccinia psidii MF-1]|uniref:Uncharacterized protein n=1 Tax=Austropuccinia psidii MF-1 TaxID=1389203 RepID=A0A9Q3K9Q1_9BASI|nr:hypothetical protein [Austropuccinia psidii MF-1]